MNKLNKLTKKPELIALGKAIRRRREANKISQENFAHDIDCGRSYYWRVENGLVNLRALKLIQIAKGLKTTTSELFREAEEFFPKRKR